MAKQQAWALALALIDFIIMPLGRCSFWAGKCEVNDGANDGVVHGSD